MMREVLGGGGGGGGVIILNITIKGGQLFKGGN